MVIHPTTDLPIWSLRMTVQTGWPVFFGLWSYVTGFRLNNLSIKKAVMTFTMLGPQGLVIRKLLTTRHPIPFALERNSLCMAERVGCPFLFSLWLYVTEKCFNCNIYYAQSCFVAVFFWGCFSSVALLWFWGGECSRPMPAPFLTQSPYSHGHTYHLWASWISGRD